MPRKRINRAHAKPGPARWKRALRRTAIATALGVLAAVVAIEVFIANYGRTSEPVRETMIDYAAMLRVEGRLPEAASMTSAARQIEEKLERARADRANARSKKR